MLRDGGENILICYERELKPTFGTNNKLSKVRKETDESVIRAFIFNFSKSKLIEWASVRVIVDALY